MKNNIFKLIIIIIFIIAILIWSLLFFLKKEENNNPTEDIQEEYMQAIQEIEVKKKYECNEFSYTTITTEDLLRMYLNDYKNNMIMNTEKAYNSLNKEYREKRFGNIEKYKEYINANIEKIGQIKLNKYSIKNYTGCAEYTCTDQYNNYYIFDVTAVMKYTVKLDTYTILSNENLQKYNKLAPIEKVAYNIQRCIDAINCKDYEYVYSKLEDTFKNNNYKTQEEFENYIINNLFIRNEVESNVSTSNQNDKIYTYNIIIKNTEKPEEKKTMTVIMQLKDNTDFTMSFSIQ